jgi:hypothetical protein
MLVAVVTALCVPAVPLQAPQQRPAIVVTVENLAPSNGTYLTPVWVGFHDGSFDLYDSGVSASVAIERLAEDGDTGALSADFANLAAGGVQGVIASNDPSVPQLAPGSRASRLFEVDPLAQDSFSYGSMVIPSNDAFLANGNPLAHPVFDPMGQFIAQDAIVPGSAVLDAGTEVNDELPMNTGFFGQTTPNTGVTENGVVGAHPGFLPPSAGGILADPMFASADFKAPGYQALSLSFQLVDRGASHRFRGQILPQQEVTQTPIVSNARGFAWVSIDGATDEVRVRLVAGDLTGPVQAAHLHVGPIGQNGAITVNLGAGIVQMGPNDVVIRGTFGASDVIGPLSGEQDRVGALLAELVAEGIYVNLHTAAHPAGELRGQLFAAP